MSNSSRGYSSISSELKSDKTAIAFIADDGYQSVIDVLKPLFSGRGCSFGAAVPTGSLGNPNRLTYADLPKLADNGITILNHAASGGSPSTLSYGLAKFRGEVQTNFSMFNAIGINPVGFVTPSSVLNAKYNDELSKVCRYAFTVGAKTTPITSKNDPLRLHRYSVQESTIEDCSGSVLSLKKTGGVIVYYVHDLVVDDANYNKIVAILDSAELHGVDVLGVQEAVSRVVKLPEQPQKWIKGALIDNSPYGFSTPSDAVVSVSNASDVYVNSNIEQSVLLQKTYDLPPTVTNGDLMTFSTALRTISGAFGGASSVGLQLKDVNNVVIEAKEITGIELNYEYTRYNQSIVHSGAGVKVVAYVRIDAKASAQAMARNPLLRFGNDVSQEKYAPLVLVAGQMEVKTNVIPSATISSGTAKSVTLTDAADNGRYSVVNNQLIIQHDFIGSLQATISGPEQLSASGYLSWFMGGGGGGNLSISPISGGSGIMLACAVISGQFFKGQSFALKVRADSVDLSITSSLSRITSI